MTFDITAKRVAFCGEIRDRSASPDHGAGHENVWGLDGPDAREQVSGFSFRLRPGSGAAMKVRNSLKTLMKRHRDNQLVRRRGRVYIINKTQKRYKARQG